MRESHGRPTDELLPLVYERLRTLAEGYMRRERGYQTLQPTALVHEAYIRLADGASVDWQGKTHFYAVAATQMRRLLIQHARAAAAGKRGGRPQRITLSDDHARALPATLDLLSLDEALCNMARRNPRHARVAEMRLFAGMLMEEIAFVVGVTERTVREDWIKARAWLARELQSSGRGR